MGRNSQIKMPVVLWGESHRRTDRKHVYWLMLSRRVLAAGRRTGSRVKPEWDPP